MCLYECITHFKTSKIIDLNFQQILLNNTIWMPIKKGTHFKQNKLKKKQFSLMSKEAAKTTAPAPGGELVFCSHALSNIAYGGRRHQHWHS